MPPELPRLFVRSIWVCLPKPQPKWNQIRKAFAPRLGPYRGKGGGGQGGWSCPKDGGFAPPRHMNVATPAGYLGNEEAQFAQHLCAFLVV